MGKQKNWTIPKKATADIREQLALNRGIADLQAFLNPSKPKELLNLILRENISLKRSLIESASLIQKTISQNQKIYIHGDYDVDGITATAILWDTVYNKLGYKNCLPYIPNRFSEGYGLSKESITGIKALTPEGGLIITADCGIVSVGEVKYAKEQGFAVIVTDHHQKSKDLPKADAVVWTDHLCAGGIAWLLSNTLLSEKADPLEYLDLAALATIADIQPLTGYNRSIAKYGLEELNKDKIAGLKALRKIGGIENKKLTAFEVGWVLGPRLNASGRLENALDSLRLLCSKNDKNCMSLAKNLNEINTQRQELTRKLFFKAKETVNTQNKVIISSDSAYHEGIIGLIAGKLTQEFHLPAIVISKKEQISKGSARSVAGVDIIKLLRNFEDLFESLGGHPMAAGFNIKNENIEIFSQKIVELSKSFVADEDLQQKITVDAKIPLSQINFGLLDFLNEMEPFGMGNPEPLFLTEGLEVVEISKMGKNNEHIKVVLVDSTSKEKVTAVGFGMGSAEIKKGDSLDLVYFLLENNFGGRRKIELKIKDFHPTKKG